MEEGKKPPAPEVFRRWAVRTVEVIYIINIRQKAY